MGTAERREREREELRGKILEAARALLLREGFPAVTMRRIAEAIEYSPTAIYHHFTDKEDVIHCLCAEDFGRLLALMQTATPASDALAVLLRHGQVYARFALEYPDHYRVMFLTPPAANTRLVEPAQQAFYLLRDAVQAAMDAGLLRAGEAALAAQVVWASLHGAVALLITYPTELFPVAPPPADFVEHVLLANLRGLATAGGLALLEAEAGAAPAPAGPARPRTRRGTSPRQGRTRPGGR